MKLPIPNIFPIIAIAAYIIPKRIPRSIMNLDHREIALIKNRLLITFMEIRDILEKYKKGEIDEKEVERILKLFDYERFGNIAFDVSRRKRIKIPEIIYGYKKDIEDILKAISCCMKYDDICFVSRLNRKKFETIREILKEYILEYNEKCFLLKIKKRDYSPKKYKGRIAIITAGASDTRYAEESYEILSEYFENVFRFYDIGVSGIHRTLDIAKEIYEKDIDIVIVFAGFEGALPSILGGLLDIPIIAVPTSTGYGFGGKGIAALLSMLNSCSPNIAVVNINSGVRAALYAYIILRRIYRD